MNPQIEDGHLDLANELVEALSKLRISGQEWQVLLVIWRKTYCWHKLSDTIALSQFQISTGLPKSNICRALKKLLSKKIIAIIKKDNEEWTEYRFNKHYLEWEPLPKKIRGLSKKIIDVIKIDNDRYQKRDPQKKTISKETLSKEKYIDPPPDTPAPSRSKNRTPSLEEVKEFFKEKKTWIDPEVFFAFYEANGWVQGKGKLIKNWKSCLVTFEKKNPKPQGWDELVKPKGEREAEWAERDRLDREEWNRKMAEVHAKFEKEKAEKAAIEERRAVEDKLDAENKAKEDEIKRKAHYKAMVYENKTIAADANSFQDRREELQRQLETLKKGAIDDQV